MKRRVCHYCGKRMKNVANSRKYHLECSLKLKKERSKIYREKYLKRPEVQERIKAYRNNPKNKIKAQEYNRIHRRKQKELEESVPEEVKVEALTQKALEILKSYSHKA